MKSTQSQICYGERASSSSRMAFPQGEKGEKRTKIEAVGTKTKIVGTIIDTKLTNTSNKTNYNKLARAILSTSRLAKVGTDLAMVELTTSLHGVGTTIAFLTSHLRSNYKMALEPAGMSSVGTTDGAKDLVMTLNKSNPKPKQMIVLLVRPT